MNYQQIMAASSSPSSPREEGVGRGPRRGELIKNVPPLPSPLLHPMEEKEKSASLMPACQQPLRIIFAAIILALFWSVAVRAADRSDVLIADFEGTNYGSWTVTGEAFGPGPAQGTLPNQMNVDGFLGHGLVNSFFNGDKSTGTLTSASFKVQRHYIQFLIGGG